VSAVLGLALAAALASPAPPSLSGKWVLNKELSEDARTKLREAGAGRRPGGYEGAHGGMSGPGGGRMGGGFGGRGMGGPGGDPPDGRGMKDVLDPPETLTITQSADEIALDDGQAVHHVRPDGRKTKVDGDVEQQARWSGAELVVESKPPKGPKITSAYLLVPEKRQLHVTSRFEGRSGDAVTVRRVYDAAASGGDATQ
jgi:hypothetical protein